MCLFALSMSISPGPVNMIALTTGLNQGFKQTLPFVAGATTGFVSLLFIVGAGLGSLAAGQPEFVSVLNILGSSFIVYMGFKTFTSSAILKVGSQMSSSFTKGFLLQCLNPKAWAACLSAIAAFNLDQLPLLSLFVVMYFVICFGSIACWAYAGERVSQLLSDDGKLRLFNHVMGSALMLLGLYLGLSPYIGA